MAKLWLKAEFSSCCSRGTPTVDFGRNPSNSKMELEIRATSPSQGHGTLVPSSMSSPVFLSAKGCNQFSGKSSFLFSKFPTTQLGSFPSLFQRMEISLIHCSIWMQALMHTGYLWDSPQPLPGLDNLFHKEFLSDLQSKPPLTNLRLFPLLLLFVTWEQTLISLTTWQTKAHQPSHNILSEIRM